MIAKRMAFSVITAPMIFIALGAVLAMSGLMSAHDSHALLHPVAEIALVILLSLMPRKLIHPPCAIVTFGQAVCC